MISVIEFAVLGLGIGAVYTLLAQGIIVVYKGSGILNFADGAFAMLGAYFFAVMFRKDLGLPTILSMALAVILSALVGALVYLGVMRPLRKAAPLARLIATLGVLITIQGVVTLVWGSQVRFVTSSFPTNHFKLGPFVLLPNDLILLGIAAAQTVLLWALYRYTRIGLATTGAAENPVAASASGWSPFVLAVLSWSLAGAIAGIAGFLLAPITGLDLSVMTSLVIAALAAALVASFSSFPLTLAGGVIIGIAQSEMARYVHITGISDVVPFALIMLILVLRGRALPARGHLLDRLPTLGTGRIRWWLVALVTLGACLAIEYIVPSWWDDSVITTMTFAVVMLSAVVITGYAGQLSLATMAFAGLGAFFAAKIVFTEHWPLELALVVGVIGCVLVGLVFGLPALRTRGMNLAVVTLGLGVVVDAIVFANYTLAGADQGIIVGPQKFFGFSIDPILTPNRYAMFVLIVFVALGIGVANLRRSRAGRRLIAVRGNERAAASLGVSVTGAKLFGFGVSAGIAGLGGILIGFESYSIVVDNGFDPVSSIQTVAYAVIGGIGYVVGPILGAQLVPGGIGSLLNNAIPGLNNYITLIGGVFLIVLLLQDPNGIASANLTMGRRIGASKVAAKVTGTIRTNASSRSKAPVRVVAQEPMKRVDPRPLEVRDVSVRYGGIHAVQNVSLTVAPGEIVGLIGPNGAGKTTLVDAITGFVRPTTGSVLLNGLSLDGKAPHLRARAGVSRSFQSLELFEDISVNENLLAASDQRDFMGYFSAMVRPGRPSLGSTALAAVAEFGLEDDLNERPTVLSYGRRSLVSIARAVATRPSILLLDEPAAGLDDSESLTLSVLVRRLATDWGIGILLIEHDMSFVMRICDRINVLDFGRLIAEGTPAEIRANLSVRAAYLGDPPNEEEAVAAL